MSMFVYEGGGGTQGSVYVDKTDTYQFQKMLIVKYQFLLLLEVRQQSQFSYGIGRVNMIVHIFTIKICGMINETYVMRL